MREDQRSGRQVGRIWSLFESANRIEFALNEGQAPSAQVEERARLHLNEAYRLIKQALLNPSVSASSLGRIGDEIAKQIDCAVEAICPEIPRKSPRSTR